MPALEKRNCSWQKNYKELTKNLSLQGQIDRFVLTESITLGVELALVEYTYKLLFLTVDVLP